MRTRRRAGVAVAALAVGVLALCGQSAVAAESPPGTDLSQGWVQSKEGRTADGVSKVKEFTHAKTKSKIKVASTSDDVSIKTSGNIKDTKDSTNSAGVTVTTDSKKDKTDTTTYSRDVVKEQLKAVSGLSDQEARLWLSSLYPEDQPDGAARTAAADADGSQTNVAAHAPIRDVLKANPTAALPSSPTANLPVFDSGCATNDVDWYWHQYGCWYSTKDQANGGDWYVGEYQKVSASVNGWYRKPGYVGVFLYHTENNYFVDYSPFNTKPDSGAGCRDQTIALTAMGFASHSTTVHYCQGKIEPWGPFLWYNGWTFGPRWIGNWTAVPDRTYGVEGVSLLHSPPNAGYYGRQFHLQGEWTGGGRFW